MWNVNQRVKDGLARTNNAVEAWHRSFQASVSCRKCYLIILKHFKASVACWHPTIWSFIRVIRKEQMETENKLDSLESGEDAPRKKAVYVNRDRRLRTLVVEKYAMREHLAFLRGIARNLSLA